MKCPYRVCTQKIIYDKTQPKITEHQNFEDCYGEECPFYRDNGQYREPLCARVEEETGDIL